MVIDQQREERKNRGPRDTDRAEKADTSAPAGENRRGSPSAVAGSAACIGLGGGTRGAVFYRVMVLSTLWHAPQNGDIVVFRKDSFLSEAVIKRIIATEGQTVDIDFNTGAVTVDGTVLEESYIKEPTLTAGDITFPFTVSPGCVFVLGDNRNASTDSRQSVLGELDDWSRIGGVK